MNRLLSRWIWLGIVLVSVPGLALAQNGKPDAINIAVITFTSGSGGVVGGPSVNSARLTIDQINNAGGIDGVPLKATYIDEAGGASKNVTTFRQVADEADVVIGYVSSSDCLAVAPVAEELQLPTIFSACTTNKLLAGHDYKWVFRTQPPVSANALATALYIAKTRPDIKSIAGLNQDYAFGRGSWKFFSAAIHALMPDVKLGPALFTKLFSGSYSSQISRLLLQHPDMLYSSFWGGDLLALIQQGMARGLYNRAQVVLGLGTQAGVSGLELMPDGVISSSEHSLLFHPGGFDDNEALSDYIATYRERFGQYPASTYPYTTRRAILAIRDGYEKAMAANDGEWPTKEQFVAALEGLKVETLMGPMLIRENHQATYHEVVGVSMHTSEYPFAVFDQIIKFPADMIMPPKGTTDVEKWISSLTPAILKKVPEPVSYSADQ